MSISPFESDELAYLERVLTPLAETFGTPDAQARLVVEAVARQLARTRTTLEKGEQDGFPLKVTTWRESNLEHRQTFASIEEAQLDWDEQVRMVAVELATEVLKA